MIKKNLPLIIGLSMLSVFLLMAIAPSLFTDYDVKQDFDIWMPASSEHLLGTNALGYDVFTELAYGARETLVIGLASSFATLILGTFIGIICTSKGFIGAFFNSAINVFALLPKLVTLIVLATFLGHSRLNLIILIAAFSWVGIARAVRSKVIHIQAQPFIESCIIQGYSKAHIALWHIIPNLQDVLLSRFLLGVNSCIMMESSLSFLGFGDIYYPTWGTMINLASNNGAFVREAYAYLLIPGFCVTLLSLSFYFLSMYIENKKEVISEG